MMKLGRQVHYTGVQKSRQSSNVKLKGHGHQGQKKRKIAESSPLTMRSKGVRRRPYAATDDTITWPPGGDGLRQWEN